MVATLSDSEIYGLRPFPLPHRVDCCRWFPISPFTFNPSVQLRRRPRGVGSVKGDAGEGGGELFWCIWRGSF